MALGIRMASGQYALGTGGDYAQAYARLRVVWAPHIVGENALGFVAGTDSGSGGGVCLCMTGNGGGYTQGHLAGFDGVYSTSNGHSHLLLAEELGVPIIDDLVLDDASNLFFHYRNGRLLKVGVADADTSWTSSQPLGVNTRPSAAGTLQFGDMTVFEIQLSTTMPSAATVLSDAATPLGTPVAGATRHFVAADVVTGTTWADRIGGKNLTLTGSPLLQQSYAYQPKAIGCIVILGDSHGVREEGPVDGNAYRRRMLEVITAAGYAVSEYGVTVVGAAATKDFDPRHCSIPGQALGMANGPASGLSLMAGYLTSYCPPDGAVICWFGSNDVYARCVTNGETASDCRDHFLADLNTAIGTHIGSHLNAGRPIIVPNILKQGTAASTATTRAAIALINADLPAWIAARVGTYPGLRLVDIEAEVTPTQADADNVTVLHDGIHMVVGERLHTGEVFATALMSAA